RSPNGSPALATAPGAHGWRIALLEVQANRDGSGDMITLGDGGRGQDRAAKAPSAITLDRLYIHGDPERGQKRAIALNAGETTITGCYVSDIKAIGQDSQAIGGWNGPGNYTIENNYLEAAGDNIRIHDNVFDGIDREAWGGDGYFMRLSDAPRDIVVDHNTIVQRASGGVVKIAHGVASHITLTNNIAAHGDYGIIGGNHGIGND